MFGLYVTYCFLSCFYPSFISLHFIKGVRRRERGVMIFSKSSTSMHNLFHLKNCSASADFCQAHFCIKVAVESSKALLASLLVYLCDVIHCHIMSIIMSKCSELWESCHNCNCVSSTLMFPGIAGCSP